MNRFFIIAILLLVFISGCNNTQTPITKITTVAPVQPILSLKLPEPKLTGDLSLEEVLASRRSIREYSDEPLSLQELSQILWAGQGITADWGGRTAPSAGGLFPLELYVICGKVAGLSPGIYRYIPQEHKLALLKEGDFRADLARSALNQAWVGECSLNIVVSMVSGRITFKYGERGIRYAQMEAGHAAQNICLQTTALALGAVTVGAFEDTDVTNLLKLEKDEIPLYVIPIGKLP